MKTSRRRFVAAMGSSVAWAACGAPAVVGKSGPRVAITMDDFGWGDTPALDAKALNDALLGHYAARRLKAGVFVTGNRVDSEAGKAYVATWDRAGHLIANHSYSHLYFPSAKVDLARFTDDLVRNEAIVGHLPRFEKFFRFPYLKEGDTLEKRDGMRRFLHSRGYRNGHVTIDASDWYVDGRLKKQLEREPKADLAPYRKFYLDHIWERASFYDDLARKVTGRQVPHTLLTHYNMLNGLFLGDLVEMFRSKGWALVDAEEAYADPIFASEPKILPAGESLVWALAKAAGKYESVLRYPGEDGDYEAPKMDALGL